MQLTSSFCSENKFFFRVIPAEVIPGPDLDSVEPRVGEAGEGVAGAHRPGLQRLPVVQTEAVPGVQQRLVPPYLWSHHVILASDGLLTRMTHSDTSDSVSASHCSRYSVSSWLNLN